MNSQRGNILFLILLAVVLFAALSYAVTSSMRGGGNDSSGENTKLLASQLMGRATAISNELNRWVLSGGYNINNIDIKTAFSTGSNGNSATCTTEACDFYLQTGLSPDIAMKDYVDPACWAYNASVEKLAPNPTVVSVKGMKTTQTDLVLSYNCLKAEICDEINYAVGILKKGDPVITGSLGAWNVGYSSFQGSGMTDNLTADQMGSADSRIIGQQAFCIKSTANATSGTLYFVIYAR